MDDGGWFWLVVAGFRWLLVVARDFGWLHVLQLWLHDAISRNPQSNNKSEAIVPI